MKYWIISKFSWYKIKKNADFNILKGLWNSGKQLCPIIPKDMGSPVSVGLQAWEGRDKMLLLTGNMTVKKITLILSPLDCEFLKNYIVWISCTSTAYWGTLGNLENPRDGGAWWAAIYGFAQSQTWLKWLSSSKHPIELLNAVLLKFTESLLCARSRAGIWNVRMSNPCSLSYQ